MRPSSDSLLPLWDLFGHHHELDPVSADLFELELEREVLVRLHWARSVLGEGEWFERELESQQRDALELELKLGAEERWELCERVLRVRRLHLGAE